MKSLCYFLLNSSLHLLNKSIQSILLIAFLLIVFVLSSQANLYATSELAGQELSLKHLQNIDLLIKKFKPDFEEQIETQKIDGKIAILQIDVSQLGLTSEKRLQGYISKQLESSSLQSFIKFKNHTPTFFVTTDEVFKASPNQKTNSLAHIETILTNLNSQAYAKVKLSLIDEVWYLDLSIYTLSPHQIVWDSQWSKIDDNEDYWVQLTLGTGTDLNLDDISAIMNMYIFYRSFGFLEWGIDLGLGSRFLSIDGIKAHTEIAPKFQFAPKIGIAILELANENYAGIDIILSFKNGFQISYILSSERPISNKLDIDFISVPSIGILFRQGFIVNLDYEIFKKTFLLNFGVRF